MPIDLTRFVLKWSKMTLSSDVPNIVHSINMNWIKKFIKTKFGSGTAKFSIKTIISARNKTVWF